ncbi:MAG: hypothetical protein A3F11_11890 [Gammaproteobacteria bacterium RIFCSPHIGHO2_12_FULL_37_14]|nr:MAG: hypothetical protein A3F11_11890 [Gammaproteobacteria bacterium RIFCSPHIGHO2_12_FULL_37_14]
MINNEDDQLELYDDLPVLQSDTDTEDEDNFSDQAIQSDNVSLGSKEENIKSIVTIQQWWRSCARYKLHKQVFGCKLTELNFFSASARIRNIVFELAKQHAIIDNKVYHWTTWSNLHQIIRSKKFLGSHLLHKYNIRYEKNVLESVDIQNGDGNVICFCPYLVDPMVFVDHVNECYKTVRKGLIRLSIDLKQINISGKFNQFFKLCDFFAPHFGLEVIISDQLSFYFDKNHESLLISLKFNEKVFDLKLKNKDTIVYGNIFTINLFCLNKFLQLFNEVPFKKELDDYLNNLTNNQLRKILIGFSQGLTIFSEYNFYALLPVTDGLISEIYCVKSEKLYTLNNFSIEQYQKELLYRVNKKEFPEDVPFVKKSYFTLASKTPIDTMTRSIIYGCEIRYFNKMSRSVLAMQEDLRNLADESFTGLQYIETRPGRGEHKYYQHQNREDHHVNIAPKI